MADEMDLKPNGDEKISGVKDAVLVGSGFTGLAGPFSRPSKKKEKVTRITDNKNDKRDKLVKG